MRENANEMTMDIQEYLRWVDQNGHITPAARSVLIAYVEETHAPWAEAAGIAEWLGMNEVASDLRRLA